MQRSHDTTNRAQPYNVLLITADQFRFDAVAAHGNPYIQTPNLDRLIAGGVSFERAYTESPVCVPARACILTGQLPHRSGVFHNTTPLVEGAPTVVRELAGAGYHTQAIGKMHFSSPQITHGFERMWLSEEVPRSPQGDDYLSDVVAAGAGHVLEHQGVRHELYYSPQPSQLPIELTCTTWTGRRTVQYLAERASTGQPFFCWASFLKPHPPFDPPSDYYLLYDPLEMPDPVRGETERDRLGYHALSQHRFKWTTPDLDLDRIRVMRAYYYACVSHVDAEIGRILDELERTGLRERTLVIFTADHGEYLGDHWSFGKRGFHDAAARIPLVLSLPGVVPAGRRVEALAGLVDVAPTIMAAVGHRPVTLEPDGHDLLPVAAGDRDGVRKILVGQYNEGAYGLYCAMNDSYKYVYSAADRRESLFALGSDETVDLAHHGGAMDDPDGNPDASTALTKLRSALLDRFSADGYHTPLDNSTWRIFPTPEAASLPGNGDRDPAGRCRQYPEWREHPAQNLTVRGGGYV